MTRTTPLIIIIAIIAAVGVWAWRSTSTPKASSNTNATNANTTIPAAATNETATDKTAANLNESLIPANANVTTNANTSASGSTNSTSNAAGNTNVVATNTNAAATSTNVGVDAVLARPATYNGQSICLTGDFQKSFETQVFGTMLSLDTYGLPKLEGPYIGAEGTVTTAGLSCDNAERQTCTGTKTLCGRFEVATSDDGFGIQHYKYRLVVE